jgi:EmrB/QacA subfamily drug resistance transporter
VLSRQHTERLDPDVRRVAIVVVLGMIMSILDTTIVNVALDSLSRDLHSPLNEIQWVVSAYLLALAAVIPLSAWAVRRYSAFRVYLHALLLFTLGSALCGLATTSGQLIAFRALQGLGGGLLAPTGLTILVNAAGRDNLPRVMGAIGIPMVLAPVLGPTLGGFLLQSVSWHAIFMINVPIGVVTAVVALRLLPRDKPDSASAGRLDWPGLLLAGLGIIGITYGLSQSATGGSFTSITVTAPIVFGALLVVAFVLRSRTVSRPLLDLGLYKIRATAPPAS